MTTNQKLQNIPETEEWFKGEDRNLLFDVKDKAGQPVDMISEGWEIVRWELRASNTGAKLLTKSSPNAGITIVEGPNGPGTRLRVRIEAEDYENVTNSGPYYQQLYRDDPGWRSVIAYGPQVAIRPAVFGAQAAG